MARTRAVALDLDGTLRNSVGVIGQPTIDALTRFVNGGGKAVIATGRPRIHTIKVAELLESRGVGVAMIVCSDGASVFKKGNSGLWDAEVWSSSMIQGEDLPKLCSCIRAALPGTTFAADCDDKGVVIADNLYLDIFTEHNPDFAKMIKESSPRIATTGTFDQVVQSSERVGWMRVVSPDQTLPVSELEKLVHTVLGDSGLEMNVTRSDVLPCALLLQKTQNDKVLALPHVATALGLGPGDFFAFGDGTNDLGMLKWAGQSACPGNGSDEAKACAKVVSTLTNDQDFIAAALEPPPTRSAL
jgi:hydroxymethylpyrimidine pyrophosphatase-like HAD family hydrolase